MQTLLFKGSQLLLLLVLEGERTLVSLISKGCIPCPSLPPTAATNRKSLKCSAEKQPRPTSAGIAVADEHRRVTWALRAQKMQMPPTLLTHQNLY